MSTKENNLSTGAVHDDGNSGLYRGKKSLDGWILEQTLKIETVILQGVKRLKFTINNYTWFYNSVYQRKK